MKVMVRTLWIEVIDGKYRRVNRRFNGEKMKVTLPQDAIVQPQKFEYQTFEEKQTDVNIALKIFEWAIMNYYDKAIILSWDSDIVPWIRIARKHCPTKEYHCILPFMGSGRAMASTCNKTHILSQGVLNACLLDDIIEVGGEIIRNPYAK